MVGRLGDWEEILTTRSTRSVVRAYSNSGTTSITLPANYANFNYIYMTYSVTTGGVTNLRTTTLSTDMLVNYGGSPNIRLSSGAEVTFLDFANILLVASGVVSFREVILTM